MAQVCVSRPIRGDCGALKRQELKTGVSDRGGVESCCSGQFERTDVFLEH